MDIIRNRDRFTVIEGSSPNCLCSDAGFVLSDLELEAGK